MTYRVEQDSSRSQPFDGYGYFIFKGGKLVARYWHDHRGEEHEVRFVDGGSRSWPVGRMTEFLEGGGPEPLMLSARAIAYLDANVG
ncbi:hypothetical protein ACSFA8_26780 [Variovorax sp. RT4R15]|uniref:hypothetical protein n=1 Tax=Variovorax sp. RT4R15 TaxID=3443737 RepID=UPI003F447073